MAENVIITGSGPAGLTAAIYAARANLEPLMFEGFQSGGMPGGQLMITDIIENYPGFPKGIGGQELMASMREQAERFGTRFVMEDVEEVEKFSSPFSVKSMNGKSYETHTLIIATGAVARRLPLDSEKKFWGKGISACAVCDGGLPVFRNQKLAVIGGGDTAVEEALYLTKFSPEVYMIHRRDELRASKIMQKKAFDNPGIKILWNKVVEEFCGDNALTHLKLKDTKTGDISDLEVRGAFEAIGHIPNTGFMKGKVKTDEAGYLLKNLPGTSTSVDGIFAAGDVADSRYRQAVSAAGSGCMAALDVERWLLEKDII